MIKYERVQVRAAEVFALDPTKLESMQKIVCDPKTRPSNFFSLDDPRVNICMFDSKGAVKVDELKAALARYDEVLKKQCVTFEECVDLSNDACGFSDTCLIVMDSHFEAVHHAFVPNQLMHEYTILDPLTDIPGPYDVYAKRHDEL